MKAVWLVLGLSISAHLAFADDDCPAAVDAAESQNPNAYKNCDYSDKGLNGVLHRAWSKKSETSNDEKTSNEEATGNSEKQQPKADGKKPIKEDSAAKEVASEGEFSTAQQLQNLRFVLIQKAGRECSKGFVVEGEKYLPSQNKALRLELNYHCL